MGGKVLRVGEIVFNLSVMGNEMENADVAKCGARLDEMVFIYVYIYL